METSLRSLAFALVLSVAASGVNAAETPTVDSILAKYIAASGGKAAMEKFSSRVMKGEFEGAGMNAKSEFELQAKAPNKQWSKVEIPGMGAMIEGFDGKVAWSKNPFEGTRLKQGDELAKVKRDAEFQRALKLKTTYPDLACKGTETVDGQETLVLESNPSASSKERMFFNTKSGLLVRMQSEFKGAQGAVSAVINVADYRAVDGVQYPHTMKFSINAAGQEYSFTMQMKEIRHNVPIDDSKFAKPAE